MAGKNNQNTYPDAPPVPRSIGNSQSSIVNPEVPCSPDPLQPDSLVPRSPLILTVSCLLSPTHASHPAYLAARTLISCPLCSSTLCVFVSLWLCPNYAKQTQFPKRRKQRNLLRHKDIRENSAPPRPKKTNPNKANLSRRSLWRSRIKPNPVPKYRASSIKYRASSPHYAIRTTQYEKRTQTNPILSRRSPPLAGRTRISPPCRFTPAP